jgi:hypothetical protein
LISSVSGSISRGKSCRDPLSGCPTGSRDLALHPAQRPQSVDRLQRREQHQAERRAPRSSDQGRRRSRIWLVDHLARLRDLESPAHLRAGQDHVAFGDPKRLAGEFLLS